MRIAQGCALAASLCTGVLALASGPPTASASTEAVQNPGVVRTIASPTGCRLEQLTDHPREDYHFQGVSHDGRWLAYSWREEVDGVTRSGGVVRDLATGSERPLGDAVTNGGAWSPDGAFLVGAQPDAEGRTEIRELESSTGAVRDIAPHPEWDYLPSYSPDGTRIVFNSRRIDGQMELFLYERASGELTRLTTNPAYDAHAEFSPAGDRILFHRMVSEREGGGYDFDLFVLDPASGEETRLTDSVFEESYGSWGPDGRHLVFSSDAEQGPEQRDLYVRAPDGTVTRLTEGDWSDSYAYWSRDGAFVYFHSDRDGDTDMYRIPMRGFDCLR